MVNGTIIGKRAVILVAACAAVLFTLSRDAAGPGPASLPALALSTDRAADDHPSFLHGRVTTVDGDTYSGRLRFGGDEEAFWTDYFNGFKAGNPWASHVPSELRKDLRRPFMARFGDIAKLEAKGRDLRVTLRSGTVVELDRYAADDFADGLRIWDDRGNVVTLGERRIRSIEFIAGEASAATVPARLYGTVHTPHGDFTGALQWNRREGLALDALDGRSADGEMRSIPFLTIRSIARESQNSARVTLRDGREVLLSDSREVGERAGGVYVDDARYGRVLISWDAFRSVDLTLPGSGPGETGPGYQDFQPGRPLTGTVTTRAGRSLTGRLVYDLDESDIVETLDAPSQGVDYIIPFAHVASIVLLQARHANVTLWSGEELQMERSGDLSPVNAGMLVFADGSERAEFVRWSEIARITFSAPLGNALH